MGWLRQLSRVAVVSQIAADRSAAARSADLESLAGEVGAVERSRVQTRSLSDRCSEPCSCRRRATRRRDRNQPGDLSRANPTVPRLSVPLWNAVRRRPDELLVASVGGEMHTDRDGVDLHRRADPGRNQSTQEILDQLFALASEFRRWMAADTKPEPAADQYAPEHRLVDDLSPEAASRLSDGGLRATTAIVVALDHARLLPIGEYGEPLAMALALGGERVCRAWEAFVASRAVTTSLSSSSIWSGHGTLEAAFEEAIAETILALALMTGERSALHRGDGPGLALTVLREGWLGTIKLSVSEIDARSRLGLFLPARVLEGLASPDPTRASLSQWGGACPPRSQARSGIHRLPPDSALGKLSLVLAEQIARAVRDLRGVQDPGHAM